MVERPFVANQIFVGLPWKLGKKYGKITAKLHAKYPLYFTIVGRQDEQDAKVLFEVIKQRILSSSYALFDATGGNANVSLEYGYAEGVEVPRIILLSSHRSSQKQTATSPIISDLTGMRRVQYTNERALQTELEKFCRNHDHTKKFEKALLKAMKGLTKGRKKTVRALALKTIRALDGKSKIRRAELVQHLEAKGYPEAEIEWALKKFRSVGIVVCSVGKYSDVTLTK
jgi:hypothetical protein